MWIKDFTINLLFPRFCINCQKEGNYLCEDCFSLIDFLPYSRQKFKNLSGLICATPYQNFIIKKLIAQFKYEPFVKDLASTLASLIIHNLQQIENPLLKVVQRSKLKSAKKNGVLIRLKKLAKNCLNS
jgi:hypothetical protein